MTARRHRVMLFEHDDALSRPLQDQLEAEHLSAACISAPEDGAAAGAFMPDIAILNPETGLQCGFSLLHAVARKPVGPPILLTRGSHPQIVRQARSAIAGNRLVLAGSITRSCPGSAIRHHLEELPAADGLASGQDRDKAFLQALIDHDRLIANLSVEFQAKYDLRSGRIAGYEALTRLRARRAINPGMIFSDAVDLALEFEATIAALEATARFARGLEQFDQTKKVSFNCSAAILLHPKFIPRLRKALRDHTVAPARIIIEITEDPRGANASELPARIAALDRLGVGISIDDFGTGAANLDRVGGMKFQELKIDKQVFWGCFDGRLPIAMLTAILDFCRLHGIKSVIEGIETRSHFSCAKLAGADYGQGFYWGRAVPPQFILPAQF